MKSVNKTRLNQTKFAKPNQSTVLKPKQARTINDITAVLFIVVAILIGVSLVTYSPDDSCWSRTIGNQIVVNKLGVFGAYFSDILLYLFGYSAWLIPSGMFYLAGFKLLRRQIKAGNFYSLSRVVAYLSLLATFSGLEFLLLAHESNSLPDGYGGAVGEFLDLQLYAFLNEGMMVIVLMIVMIFTTGFVFNLNWLYLAEKLGGAIEFSYLWMSRLVSRRNNAIEFSGADIGGEQESQEVSMDKGSKFKDSLPKQQPLMTELIVDNEYDENSFEFSNESSNVVSEPDFSGLHALDNVIEEEDVAITPVLENEEDDFIVDTVEEDSSYKSSSNLSSFSPTINFANLQSINDHNFPSHSSNDDKKNEIANSPIDSTQSNSLTSIFHNFQKNIFHGKSNSSSLNEDNAVVEGFQLPSTKLLTEPQHLVGTITIEEQHAVAQKIEAAYRDFNVNIQICNIEVGPVITRYELIPPKGVKGEKIAGLAKDLARVLAHPGIRIIENITGKNTMGIEVPNSVRQTIYLREIFDSEHFRNDSSKLTLALGKDISGDVVVTDLAKMPHLLVAGTTGSGKSVSVNAMILSILYKARPDEVKFIMIDPKMVELNFYQDIPHLLAPVVTDMSQAANALKWTVGEMERRYKIMAKVGTKKITDFNHKIEQATKAGRPIYNPLMIEDAEPLEKWPFIVVIIDELADLMMTEGKKIEQYIARIAQKARAVGIHLIIATQRPSADVITGLIKANIPTRIAFKIPSSLDSRIILGESGAEALLGQGDMLFSITGGGLRRVHGAFVNDAELNDIVDFLKSQGEPDYDEEILTGDIDVVIPGVENESTNESSVESDPIFDQAVQFILSSKRCSISALQVQFGIGYNKGARIMAHLEKIGMVKRTERGTFELLRHTIE